MTAPRIARAGRSRFFVCLGILILTVGFVAIFHSSQQQLDEMRQIGIKCEQQQEALAAQMQVVVDSKLRLEKSLSDVRVIHDQTRQELEVKVRDEKDREKTLTETNNRYSSLQQNYKILKSDNDDLKEECAKSKSKQLEEVNGLLTKVKLLQGQLDQANRENIKEIEHWKVKYKQLEAEKSNLEKVLNTKVSSSAAADLRIKLFKCEKTIEQYKSHCAYRPSDSQQQVEQPTLQRNQDAAVNKNFAAQVPIIPKQINSEQNVLQEPPSDLNAMKSSTSSTATNGNNRKTSESSNNLDQKVMVPIAIIPTQTPETSRRTTKATRIKSIPVGVVPLQSVPDDFEQQKVDDPAPGVPPSNVIESNRYLNAKESSNVADHPPKVSNNLNNKQRSRSENFQNVNEMENGAHEINDNNDFNIDDTNHNGNNKNGNNQQGASIDHHHKDHLQDPLINNQNVNNAAEDDTNLYDAANRMLENEVDLEIIKKRGGDHHNHHHQQQNMDQNHLHDGGHDSNNQQHDGRIKYGNDKLMNEIAGDQGKVAEYMDDMHEDLHMEEAAEEEDDDEYANPAARKQDPAVRN